MTKPVFLIPVIFCLLSPLTALADNHDEVTIRVMQMDEETPDSVINRIELPALDDEPSVDAGMTGHEQHELATQDMGFADEMDARGFEAEIEVQGMQNEMSTQGHGK